MIARPLSAYLRTAATAVINQIGDEFTTRIDTDDGWYIEPPSTYSLMEAIHQIKYWAGDRYEVAVIEDFENSDISSRGIHKQEHSPRLPRDVVREVAERSQRVRMDNETRARNKDRIVPNQFKAKRTKRSAA